MHSTRNVHLTKRKVPDGYELVPPDGNYAWIVAFACFVGGIVSTTGIPTFSVLLNDIKVLYETDTATVSWIPSIYMATGNFFGPVNAIIINTFGLRTSAVVSGLIISLGMTASYFVNRIELLYLTYGIINGFGSALNHVCYPIILSQYFRKYYGVVMGFVGASYASARLVYTPLTQFLLEEYGCREVFLILGASTLNTCVVSALFQPVTSHLVLAPIDDERKRLLKSETVEGDEIDTKDVIKHDDSHIMISIVTNDKVRSSNCCCLTSCFKKICSKIDFTLLREPCFYIIPANGFLLITINVYSNIYLFPMAEEKGNSPLMLTSLVSAKAIATIAARIVGPSVVTYFNLSTRKSYICLGFIKAMLLIAVVFIDSYTDIMIWSVVSGFVFGSSATLSRVLIIEIMGTKRLPSVLGLSSFIKGCFTLPVAPILGYIRDTTGSFNSIYIVLAILQFVIIVLWIIQPYLPQKKPQFSFR